MAYQESAIFVLSDVFDEERVAVAYDENYRDKAVVSISSQPRTILASFVRLFYGYDDRRRRGNVET